MKERDFTLKPAAMSCLRLNPIPPWERPRPEKRKPPAPEDKLAVAIRHAAARRATEEAVRRHITELFQQKITTAARRAFAGRGQFVIKL